MTLNLTCRHCLLLSLDPRDQQQLDREVTNFRRQAYAPTTKSTYVSQMCSYLSFCVYYGYQPIPAAALTLNRYAAFLARSLSASSIPAYLNAVRILHLEHGLTDPPKNNFQVATTLRGIKRVKGLTVSQKKPITPQILLAFKSHLNLDNPSHATFWAVCLVAFFGLLRKANLLCKGLTQFDPSKHLRRGDILFFTDWAIIINRWSKTIQFSLRILTIPLPHIAQHPLCPYTALKHAFRLVPAPLSGPAFIIPASTEGGLTPLTYGKFDSLLKLLAAKTNMDPSQVTGHSFRSGGATLAFQAQIPAKLIKRLGDWQSDAYRSYIHILVKDRMLAVKHLASFV